MKHQTLLNKSRWLFVCLLSFMMTLGGTSTAWADNADFENSLPEGWEAVGAMSYYERAKTGSYSIGNSSNQGWDTNRGNYIKTTKLEGTVTFWVRSYASSKTGYVTLYTLSDDGETVGDKLQAFSSSSTTFAEKTYTLTSATRLAVVVNYAHLDNMTYTPYVQASGPGFAVKDGTTALTSPYAYSFGLATAGTTKVFKLTNPGTVDTPIAVDVTGANGFTAAVEGNATSIPAGGEKELTITMPAASASGSVVVTPTGDGLSAFTFNVSGTIRDPNKVYLDFSDGNIPDGWTSVAIGSYASSNGSPWAASTGYISQSGSSSSYEWAFTSPKLTFTNGEVVFFETEKYSSSTWYTPSIKVEYSTDGTSWTTIGSAYTDDTYDIWAKRSVTIPTADAKYIRFSGWYIKLRNIYGGELPNEPKMVVTQPTSLDFGLVDKDATALTKTFTIANTGKATLSNINVTSANSVFTITNAPTTLAAGASQEVTITMLTANAGALSSLITVSATDMPDATFTVTGCVKPAGMPVEDFASGLPANWTNASWTFANGEATGKSSSAYLTTPKLSFSAGDFIIVKAKRYDSDTSDYLTVQGSSDNGSTWTAYNKKLQDADGLTYPDFGTIVLSDIPTTVNKIRFVGFYAIIDEIHGLNYAPILSVTTGDPAVAVSSPANYDFGECAADATVTYNFANVGAGTINITNVAITGDGATAYSTNWTTSVAAPFDLVITRTYDANRTTAQDATVTVTTSKGDFVINVTGTDKAANAPELAVSTNAINFGKVTADAVETVTVTNNGTGSMDVTIASDSEDFTVSAASLTGIGAGESKTFDITFKYGTPYGVKNGNVTVTPTYDANAAQTITVTGKAKDPATWSEDFAGNVLPTGWEAGANWTIANGKANAAYAYGTTTYLTTPALTVSATTDELTFDYAATGNYVSIKIQMSKDGAAFTDLHTISGLDNGDAGSYTITGLEAGDYQFRFANDDYNLSNFEGFQLKVAAAHEAQVKTQTIPVTGNQYVEYTASVGVKVTGANDEQLTVKFFIGDTQYGESVVKNVASSATETFEVTFAPTVAVSGDAYFTIESDDIAAFESDKVAVAIAAATVYDEAENPTVSEGTIASLVFKYTAKNGWNTICTPFALTSDYLTRIFGTGWKAYEFKSYSDGALGFQNTTTFYAGYPYIVYVETAAIHADGVKLQNVEITKTTAQYDQSSGAYFRGTYAPIAAGEWTKNAETDVIYGVTAAGKIAKAGASASMKGFRAYFDLPAGATARLAIYDDATGITSILDAKELNNDGKVYNLNGQRVENAHKGLYIVNGKKVVVK